MIARVMFVVWRWRDDYHDEMGAFKDLHVEGDEEAMLIPSSHEMPGGIEDDGVEEALKLLFQEINHNKAENKLVLLHKGNPNRFTDKHKIALEKMLGDSNVKVETFQGGCNDPVYCYDNGKNGILNQTGRVDRNARGAENDPLTVKLGNYNSVWDAYWKTRPLTELKQDVLYCLLPLAIDTMGLCIVREKKRCAYRGQVEAAYNNGVWKKLQSKLGELASKCKELMGDHPIFEKIQKLSESKSIKAYLDDPESPSCLLELLKEFCSDFEDTKSG